MASNSITKDHHLWTRDTVKNVSGDLTLDIVGDLSLDTDGGQLVLKDGGTIYGAFSTAGSLSSLILYEAAGASVDDYCRLSVGAAGVTTIKTVDENAAVAHLDVEVDGNFTVDAVGDITLDAGGGDVTVLQADLTIPIDKKVIFGNTGEYIVGDDTDLDIVSSNDATIDAGGDIILDAGGHVEFDNCAVGFDRLEAIFSVTGVIGSVGGDDTDIDFRLSNKYRLEMTGDIAQMNLIFPNTSGNFLLVCNTDGDHDVALWKVWEHDSAFGSTNPADVTDVMWAGGSLPAFTDTGDDIVSFYWDAVEQTAYGVASLAFAIPS